MASAKHEIKKRLSSVNRAQASSLICFLVEGIVKGTFTIKTGSCHHTFVRGSMFHVRFKASRRPAGRYRSKEKVKIELSWKEEHSLAFKDQCYTDERNSKKGVPIPNVSPAMQDNKDKSFVDSRLAQMHSSISHDDVESIPFGKNILLKLEGNPEGLTLVELGETFKVNWRRLIASVLRLIEVGLIIKEGKFYKTSNNIKYLFNIK